MGRKKISLKIILLIAILCAAVISAYFFLTRFDAKKEVHYHAGFLVYNEGKLVDFSDLKYMQVVPCTADGSEIHMDEQIEKAHLHDNIGNVVHVHREGAKWGDLFKNIKYNIPQSQDITAYKNGKPVKDILNTPIEPYDSIIISIGKERISEAKLKSPVTKKQILEAEKRTETCGS